MESDHGRKALPPALFVGFALPLAWTIVRLIITTASTPRHPEDFVLTSEGVGFAMSCLVIAGLLELHRRLTGNAGVAIRIALAGAIAAFASDVIAGLGQLAGHWWEHTWIIKLYDYGGAGGWLVFAIGMTLAIPAQRRLLGIVAIVITFLTWPTHLLRDDLYGWMHLGRKAETYFSNALYGIRYANLLGLALFVNAGMTPPDPQAGANGLRLGAKALWLRVSVALSVSMLTILLMAGRGSGGVEIMKLALITQCVVSLIAFLMFGAGMLRAARAAVPGLGGTLVVIGGAASLWAAGVMLAQFPHLYRMLYSEDSAWGSEHERDVAQALAITLPLVVTIGTAMLATVLARFAAFRGDARLQTEAHSSGIGYVLLMLVAIALQNWALPKAESLSSLAMMLMFAAGAGLWATILMARLLASGADSVDSEPSLPTASVISGSS